MRRIFFSFLIFFLGLSCKAQLLTIPEAEFPNRVMFGLGAVGQALNATKTRLAVAFSVPKTGSITKVGVSLYVNSCSSCVLRTSLQTLDSNGAPSGSYYGGSNYVDQTGLSTNIYKFTLGTPANATMGDLVAFVFEWGGAQGDITINTWSMTGGDDYQAFPTGWYYQSSAWTRGNGILPHIAIGYSDGWVQWGQVTTHKNINFVGMANNASVREIGVKFRLPFTCRVVGMWYVAHEASAGSSVDVKLYNADRSSTIATLLSGVSLNAISGTSYGRARVYFSTPILIVGNTWYNLGVASGAAINSNFYYFELSTSGADNELYDGATPKDFIWIEKSNTGTWTEKAYRRPMMGLVVDAVGVGLGGFVTAQ